jgi:uncharacterized damage-inducible protein DinB
MRIAADLRRAWKGAPWHGPSVSAILSRLTPQGAATRTARGSHTPWQLLLHLITWVEVPLRRLDEPDYTPPESEDFPEPTAHDAAQWARDVDRLGGSIERLITRVSAMSEAQLAAGVGTRGYSYATMLDGVCQHLAYHAGQMALLARGDDSAA